MAKWKTTVTAQKERQKSAGKTRADPQADNLKTQAQKIVDILLPGQDSPTLSKFQQVCEVLSQTLEKCAKPSKPDPNLESQLNDAEREKAYLRRENNELKKKIEDLQSQISQLSLSQELVSLLKESHLKLAETNKLLTDDLKLVKSAQQDKDRLWELELNDIKSSLNLLTD